MSAPASKQKKRSREEATHYTLGARVRAEIVTILNDGPASHTELAKLTGHGVSKIGHHIQELVEADSIELAAIVRVRNQNVHVYRAIKRAYISDEEAGGAPSEESRASACKSRRCPSSTALRSSGYWKNRDQTCGVSITKSSRSSRARRSVSSRPRATSVGSSGGLT